MNKIALVLIMFLTTNYAYGDFGMGLQPSEIIPDKEMREGKFLQELPDYFNWDEYLSQVRDQGDCGACVAFSVLGAMEARLRVLNNNSELQIDLSEQDIVSCGPIGSDYGGCLGNKFDRVCSYLHQYGVVEEACFPYSESEISCDNRCEDDYTAFIDRWRLLSWSYIWYVRYLGWDNTLYQGQFYIPSVDTIKEELLEGPVPGGMAVFSDFYDYYGGVYDPIEFTYEGLHSVIIVGWDDSQRSWICRNSWGDAWGDSGNFLIKWTEESFDIRDYDYTADCSYDLCICNYTLFGFNAVEITPEFLDQIITTTTITETTSTITNTTTTVIPPPTTTTTTTVILPPPTTSTSTIINIISVKGTVVGTEAGFVKGLEGIKVDITGNEEYDFEITNEQGTFVFNNLESKTYTIDVDDSREFNPKSYVLYLDESIENLRFVLVEEEECIITRVFGEDSTITNSFRELRNVLIKTEWGRNIVRYYYE